MTQTHAISSQAAANAPRTRFNLIPKLSVMMLAQAFSPLAFADDDWNLDRVRANEAFRLGKTGAGVLIGIVDDGLLANDPAFAGRIDRRSANFGAGDAGGFQAADGKDFHGTMVAGIAAANGLNGDIRGVAPDAGIRVGRAIGVGGDEVGDSEYASARAIRYLADAGAKVINGSYGQDVYSPKSVRNPATGKREPNANYFSQSGTYLLFNPVTGQPDLDDVAAIDYAASKDVLLVFAAGNQNLDQPDAARNPNPNGLLPLISPAYHESGIYRFVDGTADVASEDIKSEADIPFIDSSDPRLASVDYSRFKRNIIAVVATDRNNEINIESNRCGEAWQWCIAAPSGADEPDGESDSAERASKSGGMGTSSDPLGFRKIWLDGKRVVAGSTATSGAAPHVAGTAAVVRGEFPFLTAPQTQEVILTTANNSGHLSNRSIYGRGLLDVARAARGPGEFGAEGFDKIFDVDTKGFNGTFSNGIGGDGGLTKRGAGTLELSGINTFSGNTTVAGGTLRVSGSTLRSNTTVQAGGTLTGSGTVGNLVSNGVVAPGGPAGKVLHVAGNFTQLPQGVIRSTLASDGTLEQLRVAGKAELQGGTLQVDGVNASILGKQFALIDAGQGVTGQFDRVQGDAASLFSTVSTSIKDQRLLVSVDRNKGGFGAVARNANQRQVGKAADSLLASNPVFERLFNTNDANAARASLTRLAGDIHPSITGVLAEQQAQTRATLLGQARVGNNGGFGTSGTSGKNGGTRVWGEYLNSRGNLASDGNASGLRRSGSGLIFGADTAVSANTRLGGALSFGNSIVNTQGLGAGQKADISSFSLSGYGATEAGAVNLRYGASLGSAEVKTRRRSEFGNAKAKYQAGTAQIFGETGLPFSFGDATVEPYAGLAYDRALTKDFKESGAGAANLSGRESTQGNFSSTLGLRARNTLDLGAHGKIGVHAQLAWQRAYGDLTPSTRMNLEKSVVFNTQGLPRNRDAIIVGVGTTWDFSRNGSVSLGYAGTFGERAKDNSVMANFAWRF